MISYQEITGAIPFHKYQATGNDFVMIDNRASHVHPQQYDLFAAMCHRRYGIGADGVILVQAHADADFEMLYYNADGNPSTMCGNGGRCVVRFATTLGLFPTPTEQAISMRFMAPDGMHQATWAADAPHWVELQMNTPHGYEAYADGDFFVNTGSPHHIRILNTPPANMPYAEVVQTGRSLRHDARYVPIGGSNVNFVQAKSPGLLHMRTYERGVEDETLSCGTGVTAAAVVHRMQHPELARVDVHTPGGQLEVRFVPGGDIWLCGPALEVFSGLYFSK
jgi:diaminopimelate epimerase